MTFKYDPLRDGILTTPLGSLFHMDANDFLAGIPSQSVDLVISSLPFTGPFAITKASPTPQGFLAWLTGLFDAFGKVLKPEGSVVIELGATWADDAPVRGTQPFSGIVSLTKQHEWHLLQEFYWYNPTLLEPKPTWVDESRTRLHDCVSMIWWLGKTDQVKADNQKTAQYQSHLTRQDGNFLTIGDGSDDLAFVDSHTRRFARPPHSDRFPIGVPSYFTSLLTAPGDLVVDPFVGTGTTAFAAETLDRRWMACDRNPTMLASSMLRFEALPQSQIGSRGQDILANEAS